MAAKTPAEAALYLDVLANEIARHEAAGELDAPTYSSLKYHVDRAIETTSRVIAEEHLYGTGGELYKLNPGNAWAALLGCTPMHYARDVLAVANKLAKIKSPALKAHAYYLDVAAYVERYAPMSQRLVDLKSKVVSVRAKRDAKKTAEEVERVQKFKDYSTLVNVLKEHIGAYMDRAGTLAAEHFDYFMKMMANVGWDIDSAAPKPTRSMTQGQYLAAFELRDFLLAVTDAVDADKIIRKLNKKKREGYINEARHAAEDAYMSWIYKMIQKIGKPVTMAVMVGNPWYGSTLTVHTNDGERQVWLSKMIINYSKYNRMFNQFPSRRAES